MNRQMRRIRQKGILKRQLYQCEVTVKDERGMESHQLVGARFDSRPPVEMLCERINLAVANGKEKSWRDARVVEVKNIEG